MNRKSSPKTFKTQSAKKPVPSKCRAKPLIPRHRGYPVVAIMGPSCSVRYWLDRFPDVDFISRADEVIPVLDDVKLAALLKACFNEKLRRQREFRAGGSKARP